MGRYKVPIVAVLALTIGIFGHAYYDHTLRDRSGEVVQLRENSGDYRFISPLILVADTRDLHFEKYDGLKSAAGKYIREAKQEGLADEISFYFRDLDGGEWVGVDQEEKYAPASMLKVATLMVFLKLADKDSKIMYETAHYEPTDLSGQYYKPHQLQLGDYTVKDLLQQMIVESDNDAMRALHKLHAQELVKIYQDLELPDPFSDAEQIDFLSPRDYSRFFRTFYNGAYLSHFYSDEALGLLAVTKFKEGVVAGAPSGLVVSHKFGEYDFSSTEKELHDCGIVYYPGKPYFICVMTKGNDFENQAKVISGLSKLTYESVKKIDQ